VGCDDLNEQKEGLGVRVVVLLELGRDGFQVLRVGCKRAAPLAGEQENITTKHSG
jgi:hypothetical protein